MKNQKTSFWTRWCAFLFLASPWAIQAHPGHGLDEHGLAHWLTSPDHLVLLALGGIALWALGYFLKDQRRLCRCAGTGVMLLAALLYTFL